MQDKQKAFVLYYLQDFNATKAAIRAGYSEKTARNIGCNLLRDPRITKAIQEKLNEVEITTFRVLGEIAKVAYADMAEFGNVEEGGRFEAFGFKDLEPGATRAIKKIKEKRKIITAKDDSEDIVIDNEYTFELHDKMKALELIGKHLGIWGKDNSTQQSDAANQQSTSSDEGNALIEALSTSALEDWSEDETD